MRRALIFMGTMTLAASLVVFLLKGEQKRKAVDEAKAREALEVPLTP